MDLLDLVYKHMSGNDPAHVHDKEKARRLSICHGCVINGKKTVIPTGNCRICGCFVKQKTKFKEEKCPKGKW